MKATVVLTDGTQFVTEVGGEYTVSSTDYTIGTLHKFVGYGNNQRLFVQGDRISHVIVEVE